MSESGSSIVSGAASRSDWSDSDVQEVEEVADSEVSSRSNAGSDESGAEAAAPKKK